MPGPCMAGVGLDQDEAGVFSSAREGMEVCGLRRVRRQVGEQLKELGWLLTHL